MAPLNRGALGSRLPFILVAASLDCGSAGQSPRTSPFQRPPPHQPLSPEEAAQLYAARRAATAAPGGGRLLQDDAVEQVAVGFNAPNEVVVTFSSWTPAVDSIITYGEVDQPLDHEATGTVSTYSGQLCLANRKDTSDPPLGDAALTSEHLKALLDTASELPGSAADYKVDDAISVWKQLDSRDCVPYSNPKAWYQSPYIHKVVLSGLKPRTQYVYKVANSDRAYQFATPPAAGESDSSRPLRIGVWADVGMTNVSLAVMEHLRGSDLDAALLVGDLCYADGYLPKWDICGKLKEPLMSSVGHLTVVGNHEMQREQALSWSARHPVPYRAAGSPTPMFYSYDLGLVHVLSLAGPYAPTGATSAQYRFASDDLSRVNRTKTPWLVVQFHTPMYNSNENHYQEGYKLRTDMESLFYQFGVDVIFNGHVHSYERTYPVYNGALDPCGITHIVLGDGGNEEGPALPWRDPQPGWSAFREASFGAGVFTVHNSTHAEFEWRRAACVKRAGRTIWGDAHFTFTEGSSRDTENCSTGGDNSGQRMEPVDQVMLTRNTDQCPSRKFPIVQAPPADVVPAAAAPLADYIPAGTRLLGTDSSRTAEGTRSKPIFRSTSSASAFVRPDPVPALTDEELQERLQPWYQQGRLAAARLAGRRLQLAGEDPVEQVHLGLAGPSEVVVTYASWSPDVVSKVLFGKVGEAMVNEAVGEVSTYSTQICPTVSNLRSPHMGPVPLPSETLATIVDTSPVLPVNSVAYVALKNASDSWKHLKNKCVRYNNPLAYYQAPYIHTVVLKGLEPRTRYAFQPGGSARLFNLTTPPSAGQHDPNKPFKIGIWGDVGVTDVSVATMHQLKSFEPELLLNAGDLSYADGWSPRWETFGRLSEPLLSAVPMLSVVGNHEASEGYYNNVDWLHRYPTPFRQSGSPSATYWSYDAGLVHVIGLNSYAPSSGPSPQLAFLVKDLQQVDRSKTPWLVVMFHVPWYSSNSGHKDEGFAAQQELESLFYDHGVDLVISGHVHSYERTHSISQGQRHQCGPAYIVIGDGGNYEGPALPWEEPQPHWSAFREASFGAGLLSVHNATHAQWEWHRSACAIEEPGTTARRKYKPAIGVDDCRTSGDNSAQQAAVDDFMLVKHVGGGCLGGGYSAELAAVATSLEDGSWPWWTLPAVLLAVLVAQLPIWGLVFLCGGTCKRKASGGFQIQGDIDLTAE